MMWAGGERKANEATGPIAVEPYIGAALVRTVPLIVKFASSFINAEVSRGLLAKIIVPSASAPGGVDSGGVFASAIRARTAWCRIMDLGRGMGGTDGMPRAVFVSDPPPGAEDFRALERVDANAEGPCTTWTAIEVAVQARNRRRLKVDVVDGLAVLKRI
ncbi:hypothetical protein [Natronoglycomyces albus]|uniref:Uncharacterized protein n=1 Tax=Natronoglycomyces albus TaxID=2811108 RepID=A0A895XS42_9ACTN|nr:hypothetical protein [Natronoglycomyces albus]QSB06333.1 hypothetical protein JQS30_05335 [Natronoglycomyces albus]